MAEERSFTMTSSFESDITYNFKAFSAESVHPQTLQLNATLLQKGKEDVKWWEFGAAEYRRLRAAGKTVFPAPIQLPQGYKICVPASGNQARDIWCRVLTPPEALPPKGIFLHFHGGGFVLGSSSGQDLLLDHIVKHCQLIVISVEYRLAPEHVFPAALQDCKDVASWVYTVGTSKFGCDLVFLGGESAGATLASMAVIHLRENIQHDTLKGVVLSYGCFDLSILPSVRDAHSDDTPILGYRDADMFLSTYLSGTSFEERKSAAVSPAYNSLKDLGSALFLIGTEDALIDDSILMHFRWKRAGNDAVFKFVPGACHGFMTFDGNAIDCTRQGWQIMVDYINERL